MSGSHSSGPVSTNDFTVMPSGGMPALFTRMSTGPVSRTIAGTASPSATSATTGWAASPSSPISAATFSARSRCRSLTQTSAPARAIWIAIARPTPAPEPVTRADRPAMKFDQSRITLTTSMTTGMTAGRRRVRSLMNLPERAAGVAAQRVEVGGPLFGRLRQRRPHRLLGLAR